MDLKKYFEKTEINSKMKILVENFWWKIEIKN
jgi:hypothetical protein